MPPQENQKPKIVTLEDVWKLYLLLKHAISPKPLKDAEEEIIYILDNLKDGTMRQAIGILYEKNDYDPFTTILMFLNGLRYWGFVDFVGFIRGLAHA